MVYKNSCLYYGKKFINFILSVFVLSAAIFYIARLAPGDPLLSYYGSRVEKMSPEEREQAERKLGLDKPVYIQYISWLENAVQGNFGISYKYKTDVLKVISRRLPNTLFLGGTSFLLVFLIAPVIGVLCVWHEGKWPDRLVCKTGTIISCIPEFWMSLVLILVFAVKLKWLPSSGAYYIGREDDIPGRILHLILPITVVVTGHLWYYAYMVRNKLAEETRTMYVLFAKSKGLSKKDIILRHCLRNAMPSYLSIMAISVPHIMGGTYIVETVFSYPGIGTLSYESARYKDYNLLMVLCILSGILVILCNTIAQVINEQIDPRVKGNKAGRAVEVDGIG
ncbi:MAG TPA: peptide ABC transporter permease [Lachnospiraceae bacterium]|nr:peptide ABC transporter permease [Lachnospiraceae bacterium]